MSIYKIQFSYRVYKYHTIPVDVDREEIEIKVSHSIGNPMAVDWEKIIHAFYPNYVSIQITGVTSHLMEVEVN